jgi:DNA-binding IclR family transcriptional regulator
MSARKNTARALVAPSRALGVTRGVDVATLHSAARDRSLVNALARGILVMEAFGKGGEIWLGNASIAQSVGLAKATVSRITQTLTTLGYLRYSANRRQYRLGVGVLALGYSALADIDVRKIARAKMQPLANEFNGIVGLVARDGFNIQHLETCHSTTSVVSLRIDADAVAPVVYTAFGQALLWALPQEERSSLLCQLQEQSEEQWGGIKQSLIHAFACIERDGYCVVYGRWHRDVNTVGVPLTLGGAQSSMAVGFTCLVGQRLRAQLHTEVGPRLVAAAAEINAELSSSYVSATEMSAQVKG